MSIEEGSFDIHLSNLIVIKRSYGYKNPNSSNVCNMRKGFFIINPVGLSEALRYKTSFIVLSKDDLKGTRIEHGFKWAFMSLFGQDVDTFRSTMLLNVDQLQKQLDKDEFQEDGSMAAF
ncbi:hypothetical protein Tco_0771382 [Tanacetum coccineum]|uniref:Uncharacterized protein n=1 Tax=Tanacetum coccineum TaxID=301880 RepID=A0ABQ4ZG71_9ASTR